MPVIAPLSPTHVADQPIIGRQHRVAVKRTTRIKSIVLRESNAAKMGALSVKRRVAPVKAYIVRLVDKQNY